MKNLKTYILITLLMCSMLLMCGCGSKLARIAVNGFVDAITNKAEANRNIANMLWHEGFLTDEDYEVIKNSITEEESRLISIANSTLDEDELDVDSIDVFADTCRAVVVYEGSDTKTLIGEYYGEGDNDDDSNLHRVELNDTDYSTAVKTDISADSDGKYPRQVFILGNAIYRFRDNTSEPSDTEIPSNSDSIENIDWILLADEPPMDGSHEPTDNAHYVNFIAGRTLKNRFLTRGRVTDEEGDDETIGNTLNDKFKIPVYVLDPTKIPSGQLDATLALIHGVVNNEIEVEEPDGFSRYFTQLKDENDREVHLMRDDFEIIVASAFDPSKNGIAGYDYIITQDLLVEQDGEYKWYDNMPQCSVKFKEFSQEAADELVETLGLNTGETNTENISQKYFIASDGEGHTVAYLIEYPVSPITGTREVEINSTRYAQMVFNDSVNNLYINLMSGGLIVKDVDSSGAVQSSGHIISSNENIKLAFGDSGAVDENNNVSYENAHAVSSFVVKGCRPAEVTVTRIDNTVDTIRVLIPRIILTDYLEAAWAPGITGENLVVFGRKIRLDTDAQYWQTTNQDGETITNSVGDMSMPDYWLCYPLDDTNNKIAHFIDNESNEVGSLQGLTIYDFCNVTSLLDESVPTELDEGASDEDRENWEAIWGDYDSNNIWTHYSVCRYKKPNETSDKIPCTASAGDTNVKIDELAVRKVTTFTFSTLFPGTEIGTTDVANNGPNITRFYVVCTTKGMFDSALFSDWINSTSSTASLSWWNDWLSENGYAYTVDVDGVEEFLSNNYRYELSQDGVVILDLNTIAKIQEIYDKEENRQHASLIRTVFIVLGFILLAYSMILMLCWVLDTHTDLGLSTVNKLTFGNWTAIAYESDLPSGKAADKSYVDGKHMFIRCIIMIFIAALIIIVDINHILYLLIDTFGELAKALNDIIQGVGH